MGKHDIELGIYLCYHIIYEMATFLEFESKFLFVLLSTCDIFDILNLRDVKILLAIVTNIIIVTTFIIDMNDYNVFRRDVFIIII